MSTGKKTTINPVPDGPYIVKNLESLFNQKGSVDVQPSIALCRCGQSTNKPFCDGTHVKIKFSSENKSENKQSQLKNKCDKYIGQEITIYDNRSICAHAGVCTDKLANVFRMGQEPWIDANAVDVEEIVSIINDCPSGALSYALTGREKVQQQGEEKVFIAPNGPYVVSGCPDLQNADWHEGASQQQYTLCRCGASKNKPYCDGSHWTIEFKDEAN